MRRRDEHRQSWLLIGLCLALMVPLGSSVVEAKKDKDSDKCQGTKEQRKQKMEPRDITDAQLNGMISAYKQMLSAERESMKEAVVRRLAREYKEHQATGGPFVYDVLIISGGGAKGAFGAGFFEGWGKVEAGPHARPKFDMITGVSTGSLLAPFAFLGTEESYAQAADFYANPEPNWVTSRGTIKFLPSHVSMFNTCHLQDTIREAIDQSMVEDLAGVAAEDRLLLIGTTNLDVGAGRVFDLGREAQQAVETEAYDRIASILLASSAIPGAFPPMEIDGMLYADGGATSNLFIASFPGPDGVVARFKKEHPEAPLPKVRVWVLVNQQLKPEHAVTQPKWIAISGRALGTLASTSQLFALTIIRDMVHDANAERGMEAEMHLVSIPEEAPKKTTKGMFDQDHMRGLMELGRKMGADPTSWTDEIPSAYSVESDWMSAAAEQAE